MDHLFLRSLDALRNRVSPIDGKIELWEDNNHYVVQVSPDSGRTERIELEGRKAKVKDGAFVKAGDVIAAKAKAAEPLVAPFDANAQLVEDAIILVGEAGAPVRLEIPNSAELIVKTDDLVTAGDRLTTGSLNLQDLLRYKGTEATQRYIMNDVMSVYAAQGHEISSKHFEVIIRQMFNRVMITESGDSSFVAGDIVGRAAAENENAELEATGRKPATFEHLLLGITKVSIWSDSFLSAASFQDTTRVLINAAINGRVDHLHGLKENVIIGRKIPVGTGVQPLDNLDIADGPTEADLEGM